MEEAHKEDTSARLLLTIHSLDHENPPYTSTVRELSGGGSVGVLGVRDLAHAEMGLGGSLVVEGAVSASVSSSSLPGILLCPDTHMRVVGLGRVLSSD